MMVSFRPATEDDDPDDLFQLTFNQTEEQLQKLIQTDKIRAVKNIAQKIDNKKEFIKKAKGADKERMKKELSDLEAEQFQLLRNEILNACKVSGLLDMKKLSRVPGFKGDILYKQNKKNKPKN